MDLQKDKYKNGAVPTPIVAPNQPLPVTPGKSPANRAVQPATNYLDLFKDTPYANDADFQRIVKGYQDRANAFGAGAANAQPTYDQVTGYANTFQQMFKNKVGRDPNASEMNTFFKSLAADSPWAKEAGAYQGLFGDKTKGMIADNFSTAAQDEATAKAKQLATDAVAPGSAFDTWQNSYRDSLNGVEQSLQDYQSRLFEKLRPQLLTSLQSQGLLNTGGLNEAFAGAAKDLTDGASTYMAQARAAADQDIANQKYQIQSSPTNYQFDNTYSRVPNIMASGQQSLNNVFQGYMQDQNYQDRLRLDAAGRAPTSSPLSQYGGLILGGIASGYGRGLGGRLATAPNPGA